MQGPSSKLRGGAITVGDGLRMSVEKKARKEAAEQKKMENQKKRKRRKAKTIAEVILEDCVDDEDSDVSSVDFLGTVAFSSFFDDDSEFGGRDEQAAAFAAGSPLSDPWNDEPCPFTSQEDIISLY